MNAKARLKAFNFETLNYKWPNFCHKTFTSATNKLLTLEQKRKISFESFASAKTEQKISIFFIFHFTIFGSLNINRKNLCFNLPRCLKWSIITKRFLCFRLNLAFEDGKVNIVVLAQNNKRNDNKKDNVEILLFLKRYEQRSD